MVYFISDIHLGFYERNKDKSLENKLIDFLDTLQDNSTLVIVGDLFDYWFDYRKVIPSIYFRTLNKLCELKSRGIKVIYLIGNHDFGHYKFFREELGIEPIENDLEIELLGKKFYLSHGDGKIYNDYGYKILKGILRNKFAQKLYRLIHPDIGIWLASGSSRKSRHYTETKDYGSHDGLKDFAFAKIEEGFDFVVMGHRHKLEFVEYKNGYYINLGTWLFKPVYGYFDGIKFEIREIKDKFPPIDDASFLVESKEKSS